MATYQQQQMQNWQCRSADLGAAGLISACGVFARKRSKTHDSVVSYIESLLVMDALGSAAKKIRPLEEKRTKISHSAKPSLLNQPRFGPQPVLGVAWWAFLAPVKTKKPKCPYDRRPIKGSCLACTGSHSPILQLEPFSLDDDWIISELSSELSR